MDQCCSVVCFPENPPENFGKTASAEPNSCIIHYGYSSEIDDHLLDDLKNFIIPAEMERAQRFHSRTDMVNHIACRAITRKYIGEKLKCDPRKVDIRLSVNDKPFVPASDLHFNIAHSYDMFAVAFSHSSEAGLDIERLNEKMEYKHIVSNYFSDNEQKSIFYSRDNSRKRFFLYWTRKEALLKAMGLGITQDLTKIEVLDGDNRVNINNAGVSIDKSYFVYSTFIDGYYLSLALSRQSRILLERFCNM